MQFRPLKTLLAAAILAASGVAASAQIVYHRGNDANPETLDPHKTSTVAEAHILRDLYQGLVTEAADASIVPGVATDWAVSEDGLTYTFNLRQDARWSNGDPVTANDFVFALRRIMTPDTGAKYANVLYPIAGAEAVNKGEAQPDTLGVAAEGDHVLTITLGAATPYFLQLLTHQSAYPVHPPSVEEFGTDFVQPGNMVSNGAYVLREFTPNDKIVLVRNENFWDAANVQIDQVNYYPMEDRSACIRRFEAGEIDSCSDVPTEQMDHIRANLADALHSSPYLGTYYLAINMTKPGLDNPNVRRALSMAVDREFLATEIWADAMVPANSFVPPGIDNYVEDAPVFDFAEMSMIDREDEARRLMEEAGYSASNPLRVEIRYNTSENHKNTTTAIADMWRAIHVETSLINVDGATHFAYLRDGGDFDLARAGWIADYSDPQNFLFLVESDNTGFNYAKYNNPDFDALMDQAAVETDLVARAEILKQAEEAFLRDIPFMSLMYYGSLRLVSPKLSGWVDNIQDRHPTRWMTKAE
jgi:oligopeptide transport system substrate-binding protein